MAEFNYQEPTAQQFRSVDFGSPFSAQPGGEIFRPPASGTPAPSGPTLEQTTAQYFQRSQAINDAVRNQHRIDNLYEQVMRTAPPRDVEVLPPQNAADAFNAPRMRSARPPDEMPPDLSSVYNRPATPNTSGGRAAPQTIDVPFRPANLPRPTSGINPTPQARPSSLPSPAGRLAGPAVGAFAEAGFRVAAGQPAGQAAFGAGGAAAGGIVGGGIGGAVAGPVGSFVGGLVGGYVGGGIADLIYNLAFPPSATPENRPPDPFTTSPPFNGGQCFNIGYEISVQVANPSRTYVYGPSVISRSLGPILDIRFVRGGFNQGKIEVVHWGDARFQRLNTPRTDALTLGGNTSDCELTIVNLTRIDGLPDSCGNPLGPPVSPDPRSPDSTGHPGNQNFAPPRATPSAGNSPTPAPNNYAPGGFPSRTSGNATGNSPTWIPHGGPAGSPPPDITPQPLAPPLPTTSPAGSPFSNGAPNQTPASGTPPNSNPWNPRTDPNNQSYPPAFYPNPLQPNPLVASPGFTPSPLTPSGFFNGPQPNFQTPTGLAPSVRPNPVPDAYRPATPITLTNPQPFNLSTPENQIAITTATSNAICQQINSLTSCLGQPINQIQNSLSPTIQGQFISETCEDNSQKQHPYAGVGLIGIQNQITALSEQIKRMNLIVCSLETTAAIPEWWAVRPGADRLQIVVLFREKRREKWGKTTYALTIPHPNARVQNLKNLRIPSRELGENWAEATLIDNSKIRVHGKSQRSAKQYVKTVLNANVDKKFWPSLHPDDFIKTGTRPGIKKIRLYPRKAVLFPYGQKSDPIAQLLLR